MRLIVLTLLSIFAGSTVWAQQLTPAAQAQASVIAMLPDSDPVGRLHQLLESREFDNDALMAELERERANFTAAPPEEAQTAQGGEPAVMARL